jgi:hypothetical protein
MPAMASRAGERVGRIAAALLDRWDSLLPAPLRTRTTTWLLATVFVIVTLGRTIRAVQLGTLAIDLRIYRAAADAAIHGADPWQARVDGLTFAGAPPALLPYIPAALIPENAAVALYLAVSVVAALFVVRALRLPLWWLLFPPLAETILVLNSDVLVIALLVAGGRFAFSSVVVKVYAVIPLLLQRRWRSAVLGSVVCLIALPLVPQFLADRESITASLEAQSFGGLSAWGSWLLVPTVVALIALLGRGAEWLTIPAVWPYTQLHYNVLALPIAAASPTVAFLLSFAVWPLPAIAAIFYAIELVVRETAEPYRRPSEIARSRLLPINPDA